MVIIYLGFRVNTPYIIQIIDNVIHIIKRLFQNSNGNLLLIKCNLRFSERIYVFTIMPNNVGIKNPIPIAINLDLITSLNKTSKNFDVIVNPFYSYKVYPVLPEYV